MTENACKFSLAWTIGLPVRIFGPRFYFVQYIVRILVRILIWSGTWPGFWSRYNLVRSRPGLSVRTGYPWPKLTTHSWRLYQGPLERNDWFRTVIVRTCDKDAEPRLMWDHGGQTVLRSSKADKSGRRTTAAELRPRRYAGDFFEVYKWGIKKREKSKKEHLNVSQIILP